MMSAPLLCNSHAHVEREPLAVQAGFPVRNSPEKENNLWLLQIFHQILVLIVGGV